MLFLLHISVSSPGNPKIMAGVAGVSATSHPPSQKAKEDSASAGPAQGTAAVQLPEPTMKRRDMSLVQPSPTARSLHDAIKSPDTFHPKQQWVDSYTQMYSEQIFSPGPLTWSNNYKWSVAECSQSVISQPRSFKEPVPL